MALFAVLKDFTLSAPSGDSTASDESWSLATKWLKTCVSQHSACADVESSAPWYPSRLVEIDEANLANVRLIESSESPPKGKYTTLSHCWGTARYLQLTSDSLSALKQNIPLSDLPLTFKEACEVTRRLGIRYIWIDSLCISQDSKGDWLHEAALMHKVYSHSYCTIAAAASADSSQGLFRHRPVHFLYPCEIEIPWFGTVKYHLVDYLFWASQIQDQPLHRRGWVVQERLLAPRVLHFSSQQLIWECRELSAAEKYPSGLPPVLSGVQTSFKGLDPEKDGARLRKLSGDHDQDPKFNAHHLWNKIIEAYSSSLLTIGDDKLIALSGIAKRQQAVLNDQYFAGLWGSFLPSQLLWWVKDCRQIDNSPSVRPLKYRAPSWSWASVDGIIRPGGFADDGILIDVVDVSVNPRTSDPTSIIESGYLRICGVLKELRLERHEFLENNWWMTVNGVEVRKKGEEEWNQFGPLVHLDVDETDLSEMKYCLPVREPSEYNTSVAGLILELTGKATGQFRRIGIFQATDEELFPLILARNKSESTMPCESFDAMTQKHTICIV